MINRLLLLACLLLSVPTAQAVLPGLDLLLKRHPFTLDLPQEPALAQLLEKQLLLDRKTNSQLLEQPDAAALARHEIDLLEAMLRTQGYFNGRVSLHNMAPLIYKIEPGGRFYIQQLLLELPDTDPPLPALEISQGDPLVADVVFKTLEQIKNHYNTNNCFYPLEVKYQAKIDKTAATAQLRIYLQSDTAAQFGRSEFHGAPSIDRDFLQYYIPFTQGECFKQPPLDKMRLNLLKSDLLAGADVQTRLEGQSVVTDIYLTERKARTIKGGLSYDGDNKEGLSLGWEHRNLSGGGEHLNFNAEQNRIKGNYSARLTLPHVLSPQQNLILSAQYKPENSATSQSDTEILAVSLERHLSEQSVVSLGVETEFIQEQDVSSAGLISTPLQIRLSNTDELLNPTRGWALALGVNSTWDAYQPEIQFQQQNVAASYYYSLSTKNLLATFAVRGASGVINGEALESIPATKRFYAGGGGSVRGYPYQSLGNFSDGAPQGGLSFAEASAELRLRYGQDWGLVLFYDGGWAYDNDQWHWGEDFLWGYGLGLRYYTLFAPIRLDIAKPQTPRAGIDDPYQIYVSLGQAF